MTSVHTDFSKILRLLDRKYVERVEMLQPLVTIKQRAQTLKAFLNNTLDACCELGFATLKLHLFDHFIESLDHFGCFKLLSSLAYEPFDVHIS